MGLFDAIDRLNAAEEQPQRPPARLLPRPPEPATAPPPNQRQPTGEENEPDTWEPSQEEIDQRRQILNRNPVRLSFLRPCPICEGRAFIHIAGGGFVCRTCQPGLFGQPVEATGQGQPEQPPNPALETANDADSGDKKQPATVKRITEQQHAEFAAAWPWIKKNMTRLQAAGWTRAALLRRSRFRWPHGPWGVSWLPVWTKPGVAVTVGRKGEIIFTFPSAGRTITQAAHLPLEIHHQQKKR